MSSLILSFKQLLLTLTTFFCNGLFMSTVSTDHGQPMDSFMLLYSSKIMALFTWERSSTTCISYPSKVQLIMVTSTSQGKFFVLLHLELFYKRIEVFDAIVDDAHVGKACVTVELHFFSGEVKFRLDNFLVTVASNFPPNPTNINQLPINERHLTDKFTLVVNDSPLPHNPDTIITLFALEFGPKLEFLLLLCIEQVHQHFRAVTFNIQQNLFQYHVRTVLHYQRVDCDFVVQVLVLGFFVLVEVELEVVAELFSRFFVLLDTGVLNNERFHWGWVDVDLLLFLFLMGMVGLLFVFGGFYLLVLLLMVAFFLFVVFLAMLTVVVLMIVMLFFFFLLLLFL